MIDLAHLAALLISLSELSHEIEMVSADIANILDQHQRADADVVMLARAIQGEEAGRFGGHRDELATWIAHTAINRWEKPWWKEIDGVPCTFAERVEHDWHGTANVAEEDVEPWAYRIADQVLLERRVGAPDRAQGALFAMTIEDLRAHGWTERAQEVKVHIVFDEILLATQFWFMTEHPGEESE